MGIPLGLVLSQTSAAHKERGRHLPSLHVKPSHPAPGTAPWPSSRGHLPYRVLQQVLIFLTVSPSPTRPRPPGLLRSGCPGDWPWGQERGSTVVGDGDETCEGQPAAGPRPQHVALSALRNKMLLQAPAESTARQSAPPPTPGSSLAVSEAAVSTFSSCACLHCPGRHAFSSWSTPPLGLVGSQDRNVVATRGLDSSLSSHDISTSRICNLLVSAPRDQVLVCLPPSAVHRPN